MEKVKVMKVRERKREIMEYSKASLPIIDTPEEDNGINEAEKIFQDIKSFPQ